MRYIKLEGNPFDDEKAKYDLNEHKYIPTFDYITKRTGLNLVKVFGDINDANAELLGIVDHAYDVLYDTSNAKNRREYRKIKEYRAAKDLDIRDDLINYLVLYVRAAVNTDIDRIGDEYYIIETQYYIDIPKAAHRKAKATELMYFGTYNYLVDPNDYRIGY